MLSFLAAIIPGRFKRALAAVGAVIVISMMAWLDGRRRARLAAKVHELEEYKKVREEIDEVERSDTADAAFDRLRDNGWLR